jgi:ketosteroid isomerase-like protein
MPAKDTMRSYFETWNARDFDAFEALLAEDATFAGPLGTANGAGELRRGIEGLSKIVDRVEVIAMACEGDDVITWSELHTHAGDRLPVANWAQVRDGRVRRVRATFDPRPLLG